MGWPDGRTDEWAGQTDGQTDGETYLRSLASASRPVCGLRSCARSASTGASSSGRAPWRLATASRSLWGERETRGEGREGDMW